MNADCVSTDELIDKALAVGNDPTRLRARLLDAYVCLDAYFRAMFHKYTFDFPNKRLVSHDGHLFLQWRTRPWPDRPVTCLNQQTSTGFVGLMWA